MTLYKRAPVSLFFFISKIFDGHSFDTFIDALAGVLNTLDPDTPCTLEKTHFNVNNNKNN